MVPPYGHFEYDGWDRHRWESPPSPPPRARYFTHTYRHSGHLSPEPRFSNLHRSYSQGHNRPHPTSINITNKIPITQDTSTAQRTESRPPMPAPMPPPHPQFQPHFQPQFQPMPMMQQPPVFVHQHIPMMQPAPPPMADPIRDHLLAAGLADMHLHRQRSRSRGRSTGEDPSARLRWELDQQKREAAAAEALRRRDEETAALRTQLDLERRKDEAAAAEAKQRREDEAAAMRMKLDLEAAQEAAKRKQAEADAKAERQRIIDDYERKKIEDAQNAAAAEAAFKLKLDLQAQADRDREEQAYKDFVRKQRDREEEEERQYREYLRRQKEKEEAEEKKYQEFLRKQRDRQEEEEKAKKEEQAKIDATMKARLEKLGYTQEEIEIMLDPDKAEKEKKKKKKKHRHSLSPGFDGDVVVVPDHSNAPPAFQLDFPQAVGHVPVYPRVNRKYLDIETLEHYHVPWEWDRANADFIILLRELDKYETDVLFEHTRRRRQGTSSTLLLDKPRDTTPKFAWVRHKSKERSKSRGRDLRVTEIRRMG